MIYLRSVILPVRHLRLVHLLRNVLERLNDGPELQTLPPGLITGTAKTALDYRTLAVGHTLGFGNPAALAS